MIFLWNQTPTTKNQTIDLSSGAKKQATMVLFQIIPFNSAIQEILTTTIIQAGSKEAL